MKYFQGKFPEDIQPWGIPNGKLSIFFLLIFYDYSMKILSISQLWDVIFQENSPKIYKIFLGNSMKFKLFTPKKEFPGDICLGTGDY